MSKLSIQLSFCIYLGYSSPSLLLASALGCTIRVIDETIELLCWNWPPEALDFWILFEKKDLETWRQRPAFRMFIMWAIWWQSKRLMLWEYCPNGWTREFYVFLERVTGENFSDQIGSCGAVLGMDSGLEESSLKRKESWCYWE